MGSARTKFGLVAGKNITPVQKHSRYFVVILHIETANIVQKRQYFHTILQIQQKREKLNTIFPDLCQFDQEFCTPLILRRRIVKSLVCAGLQMRRFLPQYDDLATRESMSCNVHERKIFYVRVSHNRK